MAVYPCCQLFDRPHAVLVFDQNDKPKAIGSGPLQLSPKAGVLPADVLGYFVNVSLGIHHHVTSWRIVVAEADRHIMLAIEPRAPDLYAVGRPPCVLCVVLAGSLQGVLKN